MFRLKFWLYYLELLFSCIQYSGDSCLTEAPVDPVMMTLAVFSAVCVAVICAQTIFIYKMRRSEHRAGGKCSL